MDLREFNLRKEKMVLFACHPEIYNIFQGIYFNHIHFFVTFFHCYRSGFNISFETVNH